MVIQNFPEKLSPGYAAQYRLLRGNAEGNRNSVSRWLVFTPNIPARSLSVYRSGPSKLDGMVAVIEYSPGTVTGTESPSAS